MDDSPNPEFIREKFEAISHPVELLDAIFLVYKKKRRAPKDTSSSLYQILAEVI